ncbi:hypothetical protein [Clostridium yunnanense]|nr:hypothetical protein [Clostridium yunnanense]
MKNKIIKVMLSALIMAVVAIPVIGNAASNLHGGIVTTEAPQTVY